MACLVVTDGPASGRHFALADHNLVAIGRDDTCTFQIVDPEVSRRHLQIHRDGEGKHLAGDYRSANGVFVNGKRIVNDVELSDGDQMRIGATTIVYTTADYDDAEAALKGVRQKGEWQRNTIARF